MHELSDIAKEYLSRLDRDETTCQKNDIIDFFNSNNIPVFDPVIRFQEKYSGYCFPNHYDIYFRLIQGEGGLPFSNKTAFVDFDLNEKKGLYFFICAGSEDFQMTFEIDELGRYYEDRKCYASSFDKVIEGLAIRELISKIEDVESIGYPYHNLQFESLNSLGLEIIKSASDEYTQWYSRDLIYVRRHENEVELFYPRHLKIKEKLNI